MMDLSSKNKNEKENLIQQLRKLCLIVAILTPIFNIVCYFFDHSYHLNIALVSFFTLSFLLLFFYSKKSKYVQEYLAEILIFLFGFGSLSTIYFAHQNHYSYEYIVLLFIVTILLSIVIEKPFHVYLHNFVIFCLILFTIHKVSTPQDSKIYIVASYAAFSVISFIGVNYNHRIKTQLEMSMDNFRQVVENSVIGYFSVNSERNIEDVNHTMLELYGVSEPEEMIGRSCKILNADCSKDPMSCNLEGEGTCFSGNVLKRSMKDGTVRYHMIWIHQKAKNESRESVKGFLLDVSDRIAAEEEKNRNIVKYNQLFQAISQGIAILELIPDQNGEVFDFRFLEVNQGYEKLTGLKKRNIVGKTVREVIPDMEHDWLEEYYEVVVNTKQKHIERGNKINNKYFDIYAYPYEEGKIGLLVSDVTEKVQIREQLKNAIAKAEEANEMKSRFLKNVTHELRTPMNSIMGHLQLLEMAEIEEEQKEDIQLMKDAGNKMMTLINNILYLVESEKAAPEEKSCFDLRQMVKAIVDQVQLSLSETTELICELEKDLPNPLWGDAASLKKILEELLDNSIKYTERGRIRFAIKKVKTYRGEYGTVMLEFCVEDTGIGIREDRIPFLFHEFTHVDEPFVKKNNGAGIGLALCRNLAEKMGGVIDVQSKEGVGSQFTLYVILNIVKQ